MRRPAAVLLLCVAALGCQPRLAGPSPPPSGPPPTVVLGGGLGRLSTSTPVDPTQTVTVTPSETATVPVVQPISPPPLAAAPILRSPTPELRPTRTVAPTPSFVPTATPIPTAPRVVLSPSATRTAARPPAVATGVTQRPPSTAVPVPPNPDLGSAQTLAPGAEVAGVQLRQGQSAVYKFTVTPTEGTVTVTVTGPDAEVYRLTTIAPDGIQAGTTVPVGTLGRQLRAPIRNQPGLWYVEVEADPRARQPSGPFSIRVDVR